MGAGFGASFFSCFFSALGASVFSTFGAGLSLSSLAVSSPTFFIFLSTSFWMPSASLPSFVFLSSSLLTSCSTFSISLSSLSCFLRSFFSCAAVSSASSLSNLAENLVISASTFFFSAFTPASFFLAPSASPAALSTFFFCAFVFLASSSAFFFSSFFCLSAFFLSSFFFFSASFFALACVSVLL